MRDLQVHVPFAERLQLVAKRSQRGLGSRCKQVEACSSAEQVDAATYLGFMSSVRSHLDIRHHSDLMNAKEGPRPPTVKPRNVSRIQILLHYTVRWS